LKAGQKLSKNKGSAFVSKDRQGKIVEVAWKYQCHSLACRGGARGRTGRRPRAYKAGVIQGV